MSAPKLIVPTRYAKGKPNARILKDVSLPQRRTLVRGAPNPYAAMLRKRHWWQKKFVGPVWKDKGFEPMREAPGRRMGKPHGTYISDMVELRKVILLCWRCQPRFFYKRALYYKDARFPHATGRCDACKERDHRAQAYFPEERLAEPGGICRPGQVLVPL